MSSEANVSQSSSPIPYEFDDTQIPRLSLLLPFILTGVASRRQNPEAPNPRTHAPLRFLLVNPATGTMIMVDGSGDLESMFQWLSGKPGVLPASKESMEAMPWVAVTEQGTECPICLEAYEIGEEARKMPCKHRFHSGCIEKWLGIHGSCPICRFLMPVAEDNKRTAGREGEQDGGERREGSEGVLTVSVWVKSHGAEPMDVDLDSAWVSGDWNPSSDSQGGISAMDESSTNQESLDMES